MSLDQDGLKEESTGKRRGTISRSRIVEADVADSYTKAKLKKDMGLPLTDADRMAMKAGRVIKDLKEEQ